MIIQIITYDVSLDIHITFSATLSIVKMTSQVTVHPGINFFIKHIGTIFRNLFQV